MIGINRGLWLTAAAAMVFAVGCGDTSSGTDAGNGCSTDANCGTGKACHPVLKECVSTCTGSSDCPASEKTCDVINGSTAKFCKCSTDALCNTAVAGNVCSTATFQCKAKCTANTNCPTGYTCDTTSGQCKGGSTDGGMDAGVDAGVDAGTACSGLGTCAYPEVCDFTASVCKPGAACDMNAVQPATCGYAGYCTGNSNCAQVPAATCVNFTAGPTTVTFNPKTSTGPVIYFVEPDTAPPTAVCFKGFFVHSFYLDVYRTDADWPAQLTAISGAWYVPTTGVKQDITAGLPGGYYVPNGKTLRLRKYLCAKQSTSFSAGFFFTGGNEICAETSNAVPGTASCTTNDQCGTNSTCNTSTGTCS